MYSVAGEGGWLYYGQVTSEKKLGFFRRRDRDLTQPEVVLAEPIMFVITVAYPSITRALRSGRWKKLGRYAIAEGLVQPQPSVQWPVGTLTVSIWSGNILSTTTRIEDPKIQGMELMAVWDAEEHLPARLTTDFGVEQAQWHVGGPILRERRIREKMASRFPDQPWHQLPDDWVHTREG
nr:hypothetical protein [Sphingobium sp. JAI105]